MKFVISTLAFLAATQTVSGQNCAICPNGVEFPDTVISGSTLTCAAAATLYENELQLSCNAFRAGLAPECCPSQLNILFADNACDWCPNGIDSVDTEITNPFDSTETITCFELYLVTATVPTGCSFYVGSEAACCPNSGGGGGGAFVCDFCADGVEFADAQPANDGTSCAVYEINAGFVPNAASCSTYKTLAEPTCCPGSTGGGGSGGGGDSGGGDSGGNEYCYICGSADVAMTKGGNLILGGGDDDEDATCSDIEASINAAEGGEGFSCSVVLSILSAGFINLPSLCGCEGAEAPDLAACRFCGSGSVNANANFPNSTYTCGDAAEFSKHFNAEGPCMNASPDGLAEAQSECCVGGGGGGGGDSSAPTMTGFVAVAVALFGFLTV